MDKILKFLADENNADYVENDEVNRISFFCIGDIIVAIQEITDNIFKMNVMMLDENGEEYSQIDFFGRIKNN